jgi:hypothetical protein
MLSNINYVGKTVGQAKACPFIFANKWVIIGIKIGRLQWDGETS